MAFNNSVNKNHSMQDFRLLLQCTWAKTSELFLCIIGHWLTSDYYSIIAAPDMRQPNWQ